MILDTQYSLKCYSNKNIIKNDSGGIPTKAYLSRQRILIIDNDITCNSFQCLFLSKIGFTKIEIARSGSDAINLAAKSNYDLILLEILLPDVNGFKVYKSIRKLKQHKSTKVIAVTKYTKEFIEDACKTYGISEVIPKPITFDQYKNVLMKSILPNLNKDK